MNAVIAKPRVQPSRTVHVAYEHVVVVTRKTELEELVTRFNTIEQARFYLEHAGQDFTPIQQAHEQYHRVLDHVRQSIPRSVKSQVIDRSFVPQFLFGEKDLVVTVGQDGLVVNTAKYLRGQPILPVNPDPEHIDGVLLPFTQHEYSSALFSTLREEARITTVSLAQAQLNDGQTQLGFNDLFIGPRSHTSARYEIALGNQQEIQSSSGIIVSTGAGSTGWMQSVYAGAAGVVETLGGQVSPPPNEGRMPWDANYLVYAVREPFPSKTSTTNMVYGVITPEKPLILTSHMPEHGVIFSDGMEKDYLHFNAGAQATISLADRKARIVVGN